MRRKILFLDFDGPIATSHSYMRAPNVRIVSGGDAEKFIDEELVARVETICAATEAKIVLSTAWVGIQGAGWCTTMLESKGISPHRIIGATPRKMSNHFRGNELNWWFEQNPDVSLRDCVILDDDRHFYPDQLSRLIETPFDIGLTEEQARLAISMLGDGKEMAFSQS